MYEFDKDQLIVTVAETGFFIRPSTLFDFESESYYQEFMVWLDAVMEEKLLPVPKNLVVYGFNLISKRILYLNLIQDAFPDIVSVSSFSLSNYHNLVLTDWIWVRQGGTAIEIQNLDDAHLKTLIAFLARGGQSANGKNHLKENIMNSAAVKLWLKRLEVEQLRRA